MRTKDVKNWVSSSNTGSAASNPYDSDDEDRPSGAAPSKAAVEMDPIADWESFLERCGRDLRGTGKKARTKALFHLRRALEGKGEAALSTAQRAELLAPLLVTSSRPLDRASRAEVQEVAVLAIQLDEEESAPENKGKSSALKYATAYLHRETEHACKGAANGFPACASSVRFALLSWLSAVYSQLAKNEDAAKSPCFVPLIRSTAIVLDSTLVDRTLKPAQQRAGLVLARRTFRKTYSHIPAAIDVLCAAPAALQSVTLLGTLCDVCLRLRAGSEQSKGADDGAGRGYLRDAKPKILALLVEKVVSSKTAVFPHVSAALHDFVEAEVQEDDIAKSIRPALEKMLLRSPEIALPTAANIFAAFKGDESAHLKALFTQIMSASRSTAPATRQGAVKLWSTLLERSVDADVKAGCVKQMVTTLTGGKASSPDQRAALFAMLEALEASEAHSKTIAEGIAATLAKESQEAAMHAALLATAKHLRWCLVNDVAPASSVATALVQGMQHAKVPLRHAVCRGVGTLIWSLEGDAGKTAAAKAFSDALLPGLEANLRTASTNPLTNPAGPLEGYIAVALLEGRLRAQGSDKVTAVLAKNEVIKGITVGAPKPSFLVNDKVIRKANTEQDEEWLLRAYEAVLPAHAAAVAGDETLKASVALVFSKTAVHGASSAARKDGLETLQRLHEANPKLMGPIIKQAFLLSISAGAASGPASGAAAGEGAEEAKPRDFSRRYQQLLFAAASFAEGETEQTKQEALIPLLLPAHHAELRDPGRETFIEMVQRAGLNPRALAEARSEELLAAARAGLADATTRQAALAAISTLTLVAAELVLPSLVDQIRSAVNVAELSALTQDEIDTWRTPEGTLFVDVLSKKQDKVIDKNRKNADIDAWEAELREQIAKKKAAAAKTLTKDEKAAVDAQLKIEKSIRERVEAIRARLADAFGLIRSIVDARSEHVQDHVQAIMSAITDALIIEQTQMLVARFPQTALADIYACAEPRLAEIGLLVRSSFLRSIREELVDEDLRVEPLNELVTRVLYRLRFLAEQEPLDLASTSLVTPLLVRIISAGGLGVKSDDADGILEQMQLSLEIIGFHVRKCSDPRFPRSTYIDNLVRIIAKHTQLSGDAVATLRDLGESMRATATHDEVSQLLRLLLADEVAVRSGCLQALQPLDLTHYEFCLELWLACHDKDEENTRLAVGAWEDNGLDVPESFANEVVPMLEHSLAFVREAAGRSLHAAAEMHTEATSGLLAALRKLYDLRAVELKPETDRFGMVIPETVNREDPWRCRVAIAATFELLAPLFPKRDVPLFFEFLINNGALGDRSEETRHRMLDAGSAVIDARGEESIAELIRMFESYLSSPASGASENDDVTQAVVILFGRLARHLDSSDKRVSQVVSRLVEALKTPSELVQSAVADCLAPLVRSLGGDFGKLMEQLFTDLLQGPSYAVRRGAAYGLAGGMIKGRGLSTMREYEVMERLATVIEDKKSSAEARQGAVMAYETLSATLQRLFEPYIPGILPHLLACFGDQATTVRDAAQDTARVMMQNMSGHCVKLILPTLLEGLEQKQWRTKRGAIELLGSMAYCAPRQLSISLPTIIPHLSEPLKDSHAQVRGSAEKALKGFEAVIENPEVKKLVPTLLKALVDPNTKTAPAQRALIKTTYVHLVDAPSLALIIPVVDRGLRERSAAVQRDSARIVGNLAGITEARDFIPYLKTLVPLIRVVLVSPVPDARAVAAKALGTLVERLGEVHLDYIVPELLAMLRSEAHTSVDRQGAAQGLAEVLAGLPILRLENLLPEIITSTKSARPTVREGFLALLIYLPATYGARFEVYLPRIVDPILGGISAEENNVREVSMRAGRMLIANYHKQAVELLLPTLEKGLLGDARWRIRLSSVQLVAELLFRLAGISGKATVDEDENAGGGTEETAHAGAGIQRSIITALGQERRDRILASLYILRQDSVINVRAAATEVWKALVWNTPRVAKEILGVILDSVISLTNQGHEQREMASRTLGEIVSKLGRLDEVIPLLRLKGASSDDAALRAGACLCIPEILANATRHQLEDHEDSLIAVVRAGLIDEDAEVRQAAARAFDATQQHLGARAIDETIPTLLGALQEGSKSGGGGTSETALAALGEIMRARADVVFPVLVPTLTSQPISAFKANSIANLVRVAGGALSQSLSKILGALSSALEEEKDDDVRESLNSAVVATLSAVSDADGLHQLMLLLLGWAGSTASPTRRATGCRFFALFCANKRSGLDTSDYHVDWARRLVSLFEDPESDVVDEAWAALDALVKSIPKNDLETLVVPLSRALESTGAPGENLAGLCRPKGVAPLVPVLLAGLMNGTAEQREQGALGLASIVDRTSPEAIKPFVTSMVGPLIRAAGDRHVPPVKAAILVALRTTLHRIAQHCRPFYPQLQRSFVKALADASASVRVRAAEALGELMAVQPRCDPVIMELIDAAKPGLDSESATTTSASAAATGAAPVDVLGIAEAHALALGLVLSSAPPANVGAGARQAIADLIAEAASPSASTRESFKVHIANLIGTLGRLNDEDLLAGIVEKHILASTSGSSNEQLASLAVASLLERNPKAFYEATRGAPQKVARLVGGWVGEAPSLARPARESRDLIKKDKTWSENQAVLDVL